MNSEPLGVVAEIAVAITGFTAIAAVLGRRGGGDWTAGERLQFRLLIRTSLMALFASFLPELVGELTANESLIWRSSCAVFGVAMLADVAWFLSHRGGGIITQGQRVLAAVAFVVVASLLGSSAGLPGVARLTFLVGLLFLLAVALYNFVLLLVTGTQPGSDSSRK